jgi:hypothetical protein
MAGETDLHKTLKKEACRWLFKVGYRCIAAEVRLKPLGIIDAVGTGLFRPWHNYITAPYELPQVCFIECKASRADFLRDLTEDGQLKLCFTERRANAKRSKKPPKPTAGLRDLFDDKKTIRALKRPSLRQCIGLGKFDSCLMQPMANIHYILAPAGMIKKDELPPRWGLLSYGPGGISVVQRALWQDNARTHYVESAIARTLTCDIYRADDRAMNSVNRAIFAQQQDLANRIRSIRPLFLDPSSQKDRADLQISS